MNRPCSRPVYIHSCSDVEHMHRSSAFFTLQFERKNTKFNRPKPTDSQIRPPCLILALISPFHKSFLWTPSSYSPYFTLDHTDQSQSKLASTVAFRVSRVNFLGKPQKPRQMKPHHSSWISNPFPLVAISTHLT